MESLFLAAPMAKNLVVDQGICVDEMRATQLIEYLKMEKAPTADEELALTHLTLTERLKAVRKRHRQILKAEKPKGLFDK